MDVLDGVRDVIHGLSAAPVNQGALFLGQGGTRPCWRSERVHTRNLGR